MLFLLLSFEFIEEFAGFLSSMKVAFYFDSQAPNPFNLFCYYRNGVGVGKEGLSPIFWDSLFFDLLELLERYQILWEETVGSGFSPFPFLQFLSCTDLLYVQEKARLCMMCFLFLFFFFFFCAGIYVSSIGKAGAGSLGVFAVGTFKSSSLLTWTTEASILVFW